MCLSVYPDGFEVLVIGCHLHVWLLPCSCNCLSVLLSMSLLCLCVSSKMRCDLIKNPDEKDLLISFSFLPILTKKQNRLLWPKGLMTPRTEFRIPSGVREVFSNETNLNFKFRFSNSQWQVGLPLRRKKLFHGLNVLSSPNMVLCNITLRYCLVRICTYY